MASTIFIDTMVWLHYRPVADIDWPTLLGATDVRIVVPRVTIRELDRHKNQHPNSTIRERAARVLADFEKWFQKEAWPIRADTMIVRYSAAPHYQAGGVTLDSHYSDDELLASVLAWQASNQSEATLVTQDTGPLLLANDVGLRAIRLPQEFRLPPVLDSTERELAQLRRDLLRLQTAQPILDLRFEATAPANVLKLVIPPDPPRDEGKWSAEREILAQKYPDYAQGNPSFPLGPAQSEIARYRAERFKYLESYRDYQVSLWAYDCERVLTFPVEPLLFNTGTQPADDIDVALKVPDPLEIFEEIPGLGEPQPPRPPRRPRSSIEMTMENIRAPAGFMQDFGSLLRQPEAPNVSRPIAKKTNSYTVTYTVGRLKHGTYERLAGLRLRFPSRTALSSFAISYALRAANLLDPATGVLHVVV